MTGDFDLQFRERLGRLAAAVPVDAPGPAAPVIGTSVRPGTTVQRLALGGLTPILAVLVVGTILASLAKLGPFAPGASEANGPVVATSTSGDFELTIRSSQARYAPDEAIEIEASLLFRGIAASVPVAHAQGARRSPLGFGIDEPVIGALRVGPTWAESCERSTLETGVPLTVQFEKSGSWSSDDPQSDEYRAFVLDPILRLPAGTWHVYAVAEFSIGDCSPDPIELRVAIEIEVVADTAAEVEPSDGSSQLTTESSIRPLPSTWTQIPVLTAGAPGTLCPLALGGGRLAEDPMSGIGVEGADATTLGVMWPYGWTGWRDGAEVLLVDPNGGVVARTGDLMRFAGAHNDGFFYACTEIVVVRPRDATTIELRTHETPEPGCRLQFNSGFLARHQLTGLGIADASGHVTPVEWPFGFTAWEDVAGAALVDSNAQVVAREGQAIGFSGPGVDFIHACDGVRIVDPAEVDGG